MILDSSTPEASPNAGNHFNQAIFPAFNQPVQIQIPLNIITIIRRISGKICIYANLSLLLIFILLLHYGYNMNIL